MSRKLILLIAVAATGAVLGSSVVAPPSRAQTGNCLTMAPSGQPQFVTGNGSGSSQTAATNNATSNWSQQAMAFGGAYANWTKAAQKNVDCSSRKVMFSYTWTCVARAQPCK